MFILAVFQVPCRGSLGLVILITLLQGCAGMCFGNFVIVSFILVCFIMFVLGRIPLVHRVPIRTSCNASDSWLVLPYSDAQWNFVAR